MSSLGVRAQVVDHSAGHVLVVARGEIDMRTAGRLREELRAATSGSAAVVVLDASGVTFMDCAGLTVIDEANARMASSGRRLRLRAPSPAVRFLLDVTGTTGDFDVTGPFDDIGPPAAG